MSFLLTAIAFIIIFSVLVLIHEWGHFFAARKSGIKVEEFGFGLPPRIWGVKKGETLYSLNAIPFGGFVRLYGEDDHDPKVKKNPRSYSNKSLRVRTMVVLAGVFMNFLLAWFLLSVGFSFGIQPLILNGDDLLQGIQDGTVQIQPGVVIKEVKSGSAAESAGLKAYDKILTLNEKPVVTMEQLQNAFDQKQDKLALDILRNDERLTIELPSGNEVLGISLFQVVSLPRLEVKSVTPDSPYYVLNEGDVILKVNDVQVYSLQDYSEIVMNARSELNFTLLRHDVIQNLQMELPVKHRTVVSAVSPSMPAEKAGIVPGDVVVSINEEPVYLPEDLVELTRKNANKTLTYRVQRENKEQNVEITPDTTGRIGVALALLYPSLNTEITFFNRDLPTSATKINDVRYPVWIAPFKALEESGRLSVLTVKMFGNVIRSLITERTVPEGVTGPVGIAQLTYVFVQEGFLSLLRFMALLSLSLAIINVLPLPALDGGRFLFIVIETIFGKRVNPKYEAYIHTVGFVLLLLLIFAITYSDILKLL